MRNFVTCILIQALALLPADARRWVPKIAVAGFTYTSTQFDTSSYLTKSGNLTGISNGKNFTASFWIKMVAADNVTCMVLDIEDASFGLKGLTISRDSDGYLRARAFNAATGGILTISSFPTQILQANGWSHIFISAQLSTTTADLYVNGSSSSFVATISDDTISFTDSSKNCYFGTEQNGGTPANYMDALVSEVWFSTTYTAAPTNWISSGHPADL